MIFAKEYLRQNSHAFDEKIDFCGLLESSPFRHAALRTVRADLHWIRTKGNRAAHPEKGLLDRIDELASEALEKIYRLIVLHLASPDPGVSAPKFVLPDEDGSNRMCGDAVLRDDADAQYRLGLRAKSAARTAAEALIAEIAQGGSMILRREISRGYEDANSWFKRAARDNRKPEAIYEMAHLQIDGYVSDCDYGRGVRLLYDAEKLGVADASATLGLFALVGKVIDSHGIMVGAFEDRGRAQEWLEYAASHGNPSALNGLMKMYLDGDGVTKDTARALGYARAAADAGFPLAKLNLAGLYMSGVGEPRELKEIATLLEEAAADGIREAFAYLHAVYGQGLGVDADSKKANEWLEKGCKAGDANALLVWTDNSIRENNANREPRREVASLLRVIDRQYTTEELRRQAEELLSLSVGEIQRRVAILLSRLVNSTLAEPEELTSLLMYLGVAAAENKNDEPVEGVNGWASHRSMEGLRIVKAFAELSDPQTPAKTRHQSIKLLSSLVPGFKRWDWFREMRSSPADGTSKNSPLKGGQAPYQDKAPGIGRNDQCPCGSGRKFKTCCHSKKL
ncbi:MAG: SEL1-like repeat protein [Chthoniobacterales bacterium]|nr:SEL1-like repeat protein [Chthoniobacterales bacterium]